MKKDGSGSAFIIIAGAILLLFIMSFVPWSNISGNKLKDYGLFSDLSLNTIKVTANEMIDPELEAALAEINEAEENEPEEIMPVTPDQEILVDEPIKEYVTSANISPQGIVLFEDYTENHSGLTNLKRAILNSSSRPARIAVIGDSYIEGDILTMNLRELLQNKYTGCGVGYLAAYTDIPGFRTSVRQESSGWTRHEIRTDAPTDMRIIQGEYYTSGEGAKIKYKGVNRLQHLDSWQHTTVVFVAPNGGALTVTADKGEQTYDVEPSSHVQAVEMDDETTSVKINVSPGIDLLGVYLDGTNGIAVDNMSMRGNSGQTHRLLSVDRAQELRKYIDYDLIILEYGINALSSQQTDYSGYGKVMERVVTTLKRCYPNADILMLSTGDRGQKSGTEIKSLPTVNAMVAAQREAARQCKILFWDMREAMGGENSIVDWRNEGLVNPDYIHINAKGGKKLASLLFDALENCLNCD